MSNFSFQELIDLADHRRLTACVGLDPVWKKIPENLRDPDDIYGTLTRFLFPIVEATADAAAMMKPNLGFYLSKGPEGIRALIALFKHIAAHAPNVLTILDLKGGDIGDTNAEYAEFAYDLCGADAVTLHNYMGFVAMEPYLKRADRGAFILVRTSNDRADEFQGLTIVEPGGLDRQLFEVVGRDVASVWNANGNIGAVAGASNTAIHDLATAREAVGDSIPLLIPGVGKQGGSAAQAFLYGQNANGGRLGINQSSGFTHAHTKPEYADLEHGLAARAALLRMNDEVNDVRPAV